jgi:hypothetical protein
MEATLRTMTVLFWTAQGSAADPGVVPSAVRDIFVAIEGVLERQFLLRLSMLEIYNEVRHVGARGWHMMITAKLAMHCNTLG